MLHGSVMRAQRAPRQEHRKRHKRKQAEQASLFVDEHGNPDSGRTAGPAAMRVQESWDTLGSRHSCTSA